MAIMFVPCLDAHPSGRAVYCEDMRLLTCWDCGFEYRVQEDKKQNPAEGVDGTAPCDVPKSRPQESYRLLCVIVRDLDTSRTRRPFRDSIGPGTDR